MLPILPSFDALYQSVFSSVPHPMQTNQLIVFPLLFLQLLPVPLIAFSLGHFIRTKTLFGSETLCCDDFCLDLGRCFAQFNRVTADVFSIHLLPTLQKVIWVRETDESISF